MGEALITRRGGGGASKCYEATIDIYSGVLSTNPVTFEFGFDPDFVFITRENSNGMNANYIHTLTLCKFSDTMRTIGCGKGNPYNDYTELGYTMNTDDNGVTTIGMTANYTNRIFGGKYHVFAVKYT